MWDSFIFGAEVGVAAETVSTLTKQEKTPPFDHFGEMFMRDTTHGAKAIDSRHIAVPKLLALGSGKPR